MVFLVAGPLFMMSIMILISAPEEAARGISLAAFSGSPLLIGAIAMLIGRFDASFENISNALKNESYKQKPVRELEVTSILLVFAGGVVFSLGVVFSVITIFTLASNVYG